MQAHAKFTRNANPKASEHKLKEYHGRMRIWWGFFPLMVQKSHCTSLLALAFTSHVHTRLQLNVNDMAVGGVR